MSESNVGTSPGVGPTSVSSPNNRVYLSHAVIDVSSRLGVMFQLNRPLYPQFSIFSGPSLS
jgi:hypothetical protein